MPANSLHYDKRRATADRVRRVELDVVAVFHVGHDTLKVGTERLTDGTKSNVLSILESIYSQNDSFQHVGFGNID